MTNHPIGTSFVCGFQLSKKQVYIILIWNTVSGSSNLDNCFYHCLVFTLILLLKVLFNWSPSPSLSSPSSLLLLLLLLFIIYIVNLPVVRPRSCRVIYYFDTPALGIIHQSFNRVTSRPAKPPTRLEYRVNRSITLDPTVGSCSNFYKSFWRLIYLASQINRYSTQTTSCQARPLMRREYQLHRSITLDPTVGSCLKFTGVYGHCFPWRDNISLLDAPSVWSGQTTD
jgi:hypothetical protein